MEFFAKIVIGFLQLFFKKGPSLMFFCKVSGTGSRTGYNSYQYKEQINVTYA